MRIESWTAEDEMEWSLHACAWLMQADTAASCSEFSCGVTMSGKRWRGRQRDPSCDISRHPPETPAVLSSYVHRWFPGVPAR